MVALIKFNEKMSPKVRSRRFYGSLYRDEAVLHTKKI